MLPITASIFDSDPTWWIVYTEDWVLATPWKCLVGYLVDSTIG